MARGREIIIANGQTIQEIRALRYHVRLDEIFSVGGLAVGQVVKVIGRIGGADGVNAAESVVIREIDGKNLIVDQCQ